MRDPQPHGGAALPPVASALPPRFDIAFPFGTDRQGRTAGAAYDAHVRDMIEQLLFTSRGERVMRPDLGCGLLDLLFEPNSPELAATLQLSVQAQLQACLGDVIQIHDLQITNEDTVLRVQLSYLVWSTGTPRTDVFVAGSPP